MRASFRAAGRQWTRPAAARRPRSRPCSPTSPSAEGRLSSRLGAELARTGFAADNSWEGALLMRFRALAAGLAFLAVGTSSALLAKDSTAEKGAHTAANTTAEAAKTGGHTAAEGAKTGGKTAVEAVKTG